MHRPALFECADSLAETLPLVCCKWFLNLWVDALPLPCMLAAWDLLMRRAAEEADEPSSANLAVDADRQPPHFHSHLSMHALWSRL